jgi:hypothetical protein
MSYHVYRCEECGALFAFQAVYENKNLKIVCATHRHTLAAVLHVPELCAPGLHVPASNIIDTPTPGELAAAPPCPKCRWGRIDGRYCDCQLGQDLKRVETIGGKFL